MQEHKPEPDRYTVTDFGTMQACSAQFMASIRIQTLILEKSTKENHE